MLNSSRADYRLAHCPP